MAAGDSTHYSAHPLMSSVKEFPSNYIDSGSVLVLVLSHTRILVHCRLCSDVRLLKPKKRTETEYLRLKTEPNRTEVEK